MMQALRVVELAGGIAGPLAGLRLAELGAGVIKIEPAEGDWLRGASPAMPGSDMSAAFFHLNRGKRSLALGAKPAVAAPLLRGLLGNADVFITDRSDDDLRTLSLQDFGAAFPRLVHVHVSALGRHGPMSAYRGSELTAQAMAGYTRYLGVQGEPARRLGADVASVGTGLFVLQAVFAALFARRRSGRGQRIDLSQLNSLLSMKSIHLAAQSDPDVYAGPRVGGAHYPPERGWETADEPVFFQFGGSVGAEGRPGWVGFVEEIGSGHLLEDSRFDHKGRNSTGHGVDVNALRPVYEREFARLSAEQVVEIARRHAGNAAVYQRLDQTLNHPQTAALGVLNEVDGPEGGRTRIRAFPARFSRLRPATDIPAPRLGEHTTVIAGEAGIGGDVLARLFEESALSAPAPETAD